MLSRLSRRSENPHAFRLGSVNSLGTFAKVDPNGTSHECGYQGDRDTAAAQVVRERGLSTVGRTEKMLSEGKDIGELVYTSSRVSL